MPGLTSRLDGRSLKRNDLWPLRRLHYDKRKSIHSLHHLSLNRNLESKFAGHNRTLAEQSRLHLLQLDRLIFSRSTSQRSKKLLPTFHQSRSMGVLIRIFQNLIQLIRLPMAEQLAHCWVHSSAVAAERASAFTLPKKQNRSASPTPARKPIFIAICFRNLPPLNKTAFFLTPSALATSCWIRREVESGTN